MTILSGAFPHFLALHPCDTQTTSTYDNVLYASHATYQIQFGKSR